MFCIVVAIAAAPAKDNDSKIDEKSVPDAKDAKAKKLPEPVKESEEVLRLKEHLKALQEAHLRFIEGHKVFSYAFNRPWSFRTPYYFPFVNPFYYYI